VVLAYPKTTDIPPEVERVTMEGLFEINGISGDIKKVGSEVKVHLHGSVTRAGKEVSGGAINEGTQTFKMAELLIAGVK
jgi:predicted DNA-binding protein with PD1-like motif